ncbi:hypothetical protein J4405_06435 [Candidatus Woesearchaeota archaeon]|nr:hypothetical protein [Candidatus Woesearchaeota archaeon]
MEEFALKQEYENLDLKNINTIQEFDKLVKSFIEDINFNKEKYNITDGLRLTNETDGFWRNINSRFHIVVNGKIVSLNLVKININEEWLIAGIYFSNNVENSKLMLEHFKYFIKGGKNDI